LDSITIDLVRDAVVHYWKTRSSQINRQKKSGKTDQGARGAVTGGAQMDGFIKTFTHIIVEKGIDASCIYTRKSVALPGFYRPTKDWDLLVVRDKALIAAIETKSQVGPSFGNNLNNRIEEALGTAQDLWTAYREGAYLCSPQPFLGYFFMLEDCPSSTHPVSVSEPHFKVFGEFMNASYLKRYELFCRKLVLERQYTSAAFITSRSDSGLKGKFQTPAPDISLDIFLKTLVAHISTFT
jgi:hypothetical protein